MACNSTCGSNRGSRWGCHMIASIFTTNYERWQLDLRRVKGVITEYCVMGEIDAQTLRRFQSSHRPLAKPCTPVPDGVEINFGRRVLPLGG